MLGCALAQRPERADQHRKRQEKHACEAGERIAAHHAREPRLGRNEGKLGRDARSQG